MAKNTTYAMAPSDSADDKRITAIGFQRASNEITPRLIASISGLEKQGKTHFALSAPGPIAVFNCDIGMEGVVQKFTSTGKDVWVYNLTIPHDWKAAEEEFKAYREAYSKIMRDPYFRTIIKDTATELWELLRMARFGKLTQVMPYQYGPVNAEFRALIRDAYASDKNLILLHKMKSVYINDKRTKDYERAGFSDTGFLVQVNCQVWREEPSEDDSGSLVSGEWHVHVKDCRHNPGLAGVDLPGPMCSFPMLASLVMEGTGPEDWE